MNATDITARRRRFPAPPLMMNALCSAMVLSSANSAFAHGELLMGWFAVGVASLSVFASGVIVGHYMARRSG